MISGAIFSALTKGMTLWERSRGKGIVEKDAGFMTDRLARDFRNGFQFPHVNFEGAAHSISFPTVIYSKDDAGESKPEIGRVAYFYDAQKKIVFRQQQRYDDLFSEEAPATGSVVAALINIENFNLQYYSFNKSLMKLQWSNAWDSKDKLPIGIRVQISLDSAKQGRRVVRTVYSPLPR